MNKNHDVIADDTSLFSADKMDTPVRQWLLHYVGRPDSTACFALRQCRDNAAELRRILARQSLFPSALWTDWRAPLSLLEQRASQSLAFWLEIFRRDRLPRLETTMRLPLQRTFGLWLAYLSRCDYATFLFLANEFRKTPDCWMSSAVAESIAVYERCDLQLQQRRLRGLDVATITSHS